MQEEERRGRLVHRTLVVRDLKGKDRECKEDGVFLHVPMALQDEVMTFMMTELGTVVYWLRIVSQEGRDKLNKDWESAKGLPKVEEWLLDNDIDLGGVESTLHCIVYYDETGQDFEYSDKVSGDYTVTRILMATDLWIGKEARRER